MTQFFRIQDSAEAVARAFLAPPEMASGEYVDVWQFTSGKYVSNLTSLTMHKRVEGPVLPFSMAAYEIPVVDESVGRLFQEEGGTDVQLIPLCIDGESTRFSILNVTCVMDCIDERHSVFSKYALDDDGVESELRGKYEIITRLRIEPSKVANHRVFRIDGWVAPLIVSDSIRRRLVEMGLPGIEFTPV